MSTTVSYKGQTLTTVSNDTKTLLTEGKYLEDDLTLTDVSGGGSTLITKNISANGTYNASSDSADGYSQVTVSVPASAVDTGTKNITANGNNQDVVGYAAVNVNVPNTYAAGDEGKVVDSGALVAQTAHADVTPTTSDQTIDTTTNNSIKVKGDANLVAGNIKKDVVIFNTTGSYEGGGGSVETGTLVPTSNTQQITVPVNALYDHFAIMAVSVISDYTVTSPTMIMATGFPVTGGTYEYVADTWNGSTLSGSVRNGDYRGVITFSASSITASFLGNGAKTWFNAGDTYRWFAWNE